MTERRKDIYYGLILIQGTLSKTHCPHDAFAGKSFFVAMARHSGRSLACELHSAASVLSCALLGEFSPTGAGILRTPFPVPQFCLKFLGLAEASIRKPRLAFSAIVF